MLKKELSTPAGGTVHVSPHRPRNHKGQRKGQQNQRAEYRRTAQALVHDQRQPQAQQQAQGNQAEQQQRIFQRRPELATAEHAGVVVKAAPAIAGFQVARLPVGHGHPQVPAQRYVDEVNEQRGGNQQPHQRVPLEKPPHRRDGFGCKSAQQLVDDHNRHNHRQNGPEPFMGKGHVAEVFKKFGQ